MVQLLVTGLAMGSIYALVSLGFILVYNAVGAVNFAHGELVMVGAFFGVTVATVLEFPLVWAFVASVAGMALLGLLFQRLAYYPVRDRPPITFIIISVGVSIFLRNAALATWGPDPYPLPSFFGTAKIRIADSVILWHHLFIIAVTAFVFGCQAFFFARTTIGKKMQATAQDIDMARLVGIRVNRMIALTFVLSAMLSALAGLLVGPIFFVDHDMGLFIILKAFIVIVMGGFGSVPGSFVAGLFLG
ncbi:MAG: branched-chain amino acid ABC transporter permease, partial [Nitrospinota bacterium]